MSSARVRLNKLLTAGSAEAATIEALAGALGAQFEIVDARGRRLLGDVVAADAERFPIAHQGEHLGAVVGPASTQAIAAVVQVWVAREAERKVLAAEVLGAYREITLLYKMAEQLGGSLNSQRLVAVALTEARRLIKGTWGAALFLAPGEATPTVATSFGPQREGEVELTRLVWQAVKERQKAELVNGLAADPRFEALQDAGIGALIWAPLATPRGLLGVLAIGHDAAEYAAADLSLLTIIASQTAPAIENATLYEDLERLVEQRTRELNRAKELAEAGSQAKSRFLANMSHELRTPLNALLGYAQILKRGGDLSPKQADGVDIILNSGEHLLTLINDLLDLSKIEAGRMELQTDDFAVADLLASLGEIFRLRAAEQGIDFIGKVLTPLPRVVHGDERKLRQVLLNLLSNAIKYTDAGTVTLQVTRVGDAIRFEVRDTGIGIAPEDQAGVFQAFRQVVRRGRVHRGTGLGLAISKRLVDVMGGQLQLQSTPGVGSVFWFELTLPAVDRAPIEAKTPHDVIGFEGGPYRVLVIEDEPENRDIVDGLLSPLGFEVIQASDGVEGLQKARAVRPDVVLVDLLMPVMDGYQTIAEIRRDPALKDLVVIVLSASVFPADRKHSVDVGGDDFVPKPVRAEELLDTLGQHLGIQWRRRLAPTTAPAPRPSGAFVVPPPEALRPLYEAARAGRIAGVRKALDVLEAQDPRFEGFVGPLRKLAGSFQLEQIGARLADLMG